MHQDLFGAHFTEPSLKWRSSIPCSHVCNSSDWYYNWNKDSVEWLLFVVDSDSCRSPCLEYPVPLHLSPKGPSSLYSIFCHFVHYNFKMHVRGGDNPCLYCCCNMLSAFPLNRCHFMSLYVIFCHLVSLESHQMSFDVKCCHLMSF